jgi:hypothetical protein
MWKAIKSILKSLRGVGLFITCGGYGKVAEYGEVKLVLVYINWVKIRL